MPVSISHPLLAAALAVSSGVHAEAPSTRQLPAVPDTHGFAGAYSGIIGHHLLAAGGANFPDGVMPWKGGKKVWHDTLFALDLASPQSGWKTLGKLPQVAGYGVSLSVKEGIVLIGGGDATEHFKSTRLLTLDGEGQPSFRDLPPLPVGLANLSGALVGRRIHLCGGMEKPDSTTASNAHWMLDLDALDKGWQAQPALPAAGRILATAAAIQDAFFLIGGCSLAPDAAGKPVRTYLRDAWKFSEGKWTRLADLPRAAVASASPAPTSGTSLFIVSGDDGTQVGLKSPEEHRGFCKDVLRYDSSSNSWSTAGELNVPPPVTTAITPWNGDFLFYNGEVRPGVRTPSVFSLHLPAHD
jgi:N-acetylneuraminic acid mutarotase